MPENKKNKKIKITKTENVAVIGFGVTGKAVAKFLTSRGASVSVFEGKSRNYFDQNELNKFSNVEFYFDTLDFDPTQFDYVVTSPGASLEIPPIVRAMETGIPVHNDLTLFMREWRKIGRVIGVTGSNGKTTTVSLMYQCVKQVAPAILGGNIGNSPLDLLDIEYSTGIIAVLEISSNQLDLFKPEDYVDVCVLTNLSSNHLDRYHGSMNEYGAAKLRGVDKKKTKTLICLDDSGTQKHIIPQLKCDNIYVVSFEQSVDQAVFPGIYMDHDSNLIYADVVYQGANKFTRSQSDDELQNNAQTEILFENVNNRKLIGLHNLYNIAFILLAMKISNLPINKKVIDTIRNFVGLEHRIEKVIEKNGVLYVNDSKSTSPDSIRVALEAVGGDGNVILIVGGDDKDMSFDYLSEIISEKVKKMIIIPGNLNKKFIKLSKKSGVEFVEIDEFTDAISYAKQNAIAGDVVLLSPGSYSKNYFKNFEDRGEKFKKIVLGLFEK